MEVPFSRQSERYMCDPSLTWTSNLFGKTAIVLLVFWQSCSDKNINTEKFCQILLVLLSLNNLSDVHTSFHIKSTCFIFNQLDLYKFPLWSKLSIQQQKSEDTFRYQNYSLSKRWIIHSFSKWGAWVSSLKSLLSQRRIMRRPSRDHPT